MMGLVNMILNRCGFGECFVPSNCTSRRGVLDEEQNNDTIRHKRQGLDYVASNCSSELGAILPYHSQYGQCHSPLTCCSTVALTRMSFHQPTLSTFYPAHHSPDISRYH